MGDKVVIEAKERTIIGKKVKNLRAEGRIPAVVYGPLQNPVSLEIEWSKLRIALLEAGGTNLVEINTDNDTYTTLIRQVDRHPVRHDVMHVDFYAVNLKERLVSTIPVTLINLVETRNRLECSISQEATSVEVESLPTDIPDEIFVDVSVLEYIGQSIHVSDLPEIEGATYVTDLEQPVVLTRELREIEEEEEEEELDMEMASMEPEVISERQDEEEIED